MEELNKEQGQEQTVTETNNEEKLTFTREELDQLLQKTADARVSQALKTVEKKNQEKLREAEKLANMSAEQKYVYELEKREAAIAAKEAELTMAENRNVCSKILADKGISLDLVDFVCSGDAEEMQSNINKLDRAFKNSVKSEVEKRLSSSTPAKAVNIDKTYTAADFAKMPVAQMEEIIKSNPEAYGYHN